MNNKFTKNLVTIFGLYSTVYPMLIQANDILSGEIILSSVRLIGVFSGGVMLAIAARWDDLRVS